ncbi:hypothetical protein D9M70_289160 [compost metagenome]
MGDKNEGDAELALQLLQLALHLLAQLQVEGAEGFVEQQHPWTVDQGAGQGHTLALTAGELYRLTLAVATEGDHVEGFFGALETFGLADAFDFQAVGDVVANVHVREQRVILEHGVHVALVRRQAGGLLAMNTDGARARLFKTGNQAQTGGLARAGRPQHGEKLAVLDVDGNPVYGFHFAELTGNVGELDCKRHGAMLQKGEGRRSGPAWTSEKTESCSRMCGWNTDCGEGACPRWAAQQP